MDRICMKDEKPVIPIDYDAVKSLKTGDVRSFDVLFRKYSQRLYKFSMSYLKSEEEAREIVQDVFLYIWENREKLKPECSFNAYLFTIAYSRVKKFFLRKLRDTNARDELIYSLLKQENNLDRVVDFRSLLEKVEQIILQFTERRRQIFLKRKYEGWPVKQIAEEFGISPNTVENHLSSAMKKLREELRRNNISELFFWMFFLPCDRDKTPK